MKRRYRITTFGYVVILSAVILLLLLVLGIVKIVSCAAEKKTDTDPAETAAVEAVDDTDDTDDTEDADGWEDVSTTVSQTTAPVITDATPVPQATAEPDDSDADAASRTPTPEEIANARYAKMTSGGVVLRAAPNKNGDILGKYANGTELYIYASASDDYYFVQMIQDGKYGYMAKKFIKTAVATAAPTATPEPLDVPEGAVEGYVCKSKVALRSAPDLTDDSNKIGQLLQNDAVFIYYKTGDFYYIEVPSTGVKAYAYSTYIKAKGAVPTQE